MAAVAHPAPYFAAIAPVGAKILLIPLLNKLGVKNFSIDFAATGRQLRIPHQIFVLLSPLQAMKPRTTTILYWVLTTLFCLLMLADGLAGLAGETHGQDAMRQLGYPLYIMTITGAAKILGALALLQNKYRTLKEWAFAGFAIDFIGAAASVALAGMGFVATLPALVMTAVLFGLYFLWKRYLASRAQPAEAEAASETFTTAALATL